MSATPKTYDELVQENERLRASEQRYKLILEALNGIIYEYDSLSGAVVLSKGLYELLGYAPNEVPATAKWWLEQIHPDDGPQIKQRFEADETSRSPLVNEYRIRHRSGRWLHVLDHAVLLRDDAGKLLKTTGSILDMTERRRAVELLRESEHRLRSVVSTALDSIVTTDEHGLILTFNPAAEKLFGYRRAEIMGQNARVLLAEPHRLDHDMCLANYRRSRNARILYSGHEVAGRHKDGSTFPMELALSAFSSGHDKICFTEVARDITERRRAEEALRTSEERMRQAVSASGLGVFDHNHRTDVLAWSPEMRAIYGIGPDEPVNLSMIINFYHPDDRERVIAAVEKAHDPSGTGAYSVESRIVRRDGSVRMLTRRAQTFFGDEGGERIPVRTVGVVLDITNLLKTQDALQTPGLREKV